MDSLANTSCSRAGPHGPFRRLFFTRTGFRPASSAGQTSLENALINCNHDVTGAIYHRRLCINQQGISMNFSSFFARVVALIGGAALALRRLQGTEPKPAWGDAPQIPLAKPQGAIPTLKMPTARGWSEGQS